MDSSIILLSDEEEIIVKPSTSSGAQASTSISTKKFNFFFNRENTETVVENAQEIGKPEFESISPVKEPEVEPILEVEEPMKNAESKSKRKRRLKIQSEMEKPVSEPSTSNAIPEEAIENAPPKKKRRTKEEIEEEKIQKEFNKFLRDEKASKNSKAEQYLYCYMNKNILAIDEELENSLMTVFNERTPKIGEQLKFVEEKPMMIFWKRKRLDAMREGGKVVRLDTMDIEGVFAIVLDGPSFLELIKKDSIMRYVSECLKEFGQDDPHLTIIVFGRHSVREKQLHQTTIEAFERFRVQFRFVDNSIDFSYLIAQMHRAIAKIERKIEAAVASPLPIVNAEKGISEGHNLQIDWWTRMLSHMFRLSEENKRAIVKEYPNPFQLIDFLLSMDGG
uniref:Uncharacterized protein n=1 Tax=Acrobeloides nanus TaxID=290746 RepID=A0A914ESU7_9BILA